MENTDKKINIEGVDYEKDQVIFDNQDLTYVVRANHNLIEGVINVDKEGCLKKGYFKPTFLNVTLIDDAGKYHTCLNRRIISSKSLYAEDRRGLFIYTPNTRIFDRIKRSSLSSNQKQALPYSIDSKTIKAHSKLLSASQGIISTAAKNIAKTIKGLSLGLEFETSRGLIPNDIQLLSGLVPLRDGSIGGAEYVTIPLEGEQGMQTLVNAISAVDKYTTADEACSLHYHFGEIPRTEEFMVALWYVLSNIQNSLFLMQPPYKMLNYGFKRKAYSGPLPNAVTMKMHPSRTVKENFTEIFDYLAGRECYLGDYNGDLSNVTVHPSDPNNNAKWNVTTRYHILNMIPLIFGNKKTVEFRHSEISTNPQLIVNELIIYASIINYVKENTKLILERPANDQHLLVNLVRRLNYSDSVASNLIDFIQSKQNIVAQLFRSKALFMNFNSFGFRNVVGGTIKIDLPVVNSEFFKDSANTKGLIYCSIDNAQISPVFNYIPHNTFNLTPRPMVISNRGSVHRNEALGMIRNVYRSIEIIRETSNITSTEYDYFRSMDLRYTIDGRDQRNRLNSETHYARFSSNLISKVLIDIHRVTRSTLPHDELMDVVNRPLLNNNDAIVKALRMFAETSSSFSVIFNSVMLEFNSMLSRNNESLRYINTVPNSYVVINESAERINPFINYNANLLLAIVVCKLDVFKLKVDFVVRDNESITRAGAETIQMLAPTSPGTKSFISFVFLKFTKGDMFYDLDIELNMRHNGYSSSVHESFTESQTNTEKLITDNLHELFFDQVQRYRQGLSEITTIDEQGGIVMGATSYYNGIFQRINKPETNA